MTDSQCSSGTSGPSEGGPVQNTDHHLWPQTSEDAHAPSLFVTADGEGIGIDVAGSVYVKTLREWHRLAGGPISILDVAQAAPVPLTLDWLEAFALEMKPFGYSKDNAAIDDFLKAVRARTTLAPPSTSRATPATCPVCGNSPPTALCSVASTSGKTGAA